jgi:hypothetical protein
LPPAREDKAFSGISALTVLELRRPRRISGMARRSGGRYINKE